MQSQLTRERGLSVAAFLGWLADRAASAALEAVMAAVLTAAFRWLKRQSFPRLPSPRKALEVILTGVFFLWVATPFGFMPPSLGAPDPTWWAREKWFWVAMALKLVILTGLFTRAALA